jgi:metal-responsive CopG/Arc/MetJ family transcriptional regulator
MRTTLTIDDQLFDEAVALAQPGIDRAEMLREAIRTYIRVQAGRRLAALGGAAPSARVPRRRRSSARHGKA